MIRAINLDSMFVPAPLPEIEFETFIFNGGEVHLKLNNRIDYSKIVKVIITNRIKNSDDLMSILIAKDALERKGVKNFELVMPYIPYARQDRVCVDGESFTLKVFINLINSANFDKVIVLDPHSDVAPALINNCKIVNNHGFVDRCIYEIYNKLDKGLNHKHYERFYLISPDAGSNKKISKLAIKNVVSLDGCNVIKCDKNRNVLNGNITDVTVYADELQGKDCIIVDDICDGGRTFIELAKKLKEKNAGNLYLLITHGIFSNGLSVLGEYFKKIYCTNSFKDVEDRKFVKQIKIQL
jgi:ribose-phosphate pyrophosphokinase